ncbi:hypothetical protein K435DRAFT_967950 [Dendrothele bispora CBS 962.96]|uniref:Uncharacterized protein n=1 Tax=Dendrothele bispora (strain CBS 962.96) TaxID=1314807 RepID=A0A4S8LS58_DENBC|nr:hypothetical protein K435DRAFT_967950 [Dendrothele bispora CBS 962.96]
MRLLQQLSEVNEELWWPERLKCTKTTYKIDLLGRRYKEATSALPYRIAVHYTGKDAYAVWEQDLVKYSNQHPNLVHLYGFNRQKSNPSLIFCDDVIPFMQVWEDCSPIVKWCIDYSYFDAAYKVKRDMIGHENLQNAVFIRCDTGEICFGSQQSSKPIPSRLYDYGFFSEIPGISLPFSLYRDEAGLEKYLLGMMGQKNPQAPVLDPSSVLMPVNTPLCSNFIDVAYTGVVPLPSVLQMDFYKREPKLIGSFKNMHQSNSYTLEPWKCDDFYSPVGYLLGTGWTRFHCENYIGKKFQLRVLCARDAVQRIYNAWLHQKEYFPNAIGEDAFDIFGIDLITELTFHLKNEIDIRRVARPVVMPKDVFLFIAPVALNKCPESGSVEVRWLANGRDHYFWSFDPSGSVPLSRRVCNILGLPSYKTSISLRTPISYDYHSEAVKYLQEIQGFDPLTQDYARARGLPLLEILSPSERFHLNVVALTEENQEALDVWSDAKETLSNVSESVYGDASSQLQTILFPIPSAERKLNWTTPNLGNFEGDFPFHEESDDSALQALGLNLSLGSALIAGCKPSSWLCAYLIQGDVKSWTGERDRYRSKFCWRFVPNASIWVGINKK